VLKTKKLEQFARLVEQKRIQAPPRQMNSAAAPI